MRHAFPLGLVLALASSTLACSGGATSSTDASHAAVETAPTLQVDDVRAAIDALNAQRADATIAPYYADGDRIEGCWRNPAGNKLTDLKKAFYCAMPLEFRLCNTVVLLSTDDSDVEQRYQAYEQCQSRVDGVFGNKGLFVYDDRVSTMYRQLFLQGGTLSDDDTAAVVAAGKPQYSTRSFARVLLSIGDSLTGEAKDLALDDLRRLEDDFHSAGGEAR